MVAPLRMHRVVCRQDGAVVTVQLLCNLAMASTTQLLLRLRLYAAGFYRRQVVEQRVSEYLKYFGSRKVLVPFP